VKHCAVLRDAPQRRGTNWDRQAQGGTKQDPRERRCTASQTTNNKTQLPSVVNLTAKNPYDVETSSNNGPEMSGISWTFTREPIPA
jgi:hypothetical protein